VLFRSATVTAAGETSPIILLPDLLTILSNMPIPLAAAIAPPAISATSNNSVVAFFMFSLEVEIPPKPNERRLLLILVRLLRFLFAMLLKFNDFND
jgi:hypothetical protein